MSLSEGEIAADARSLAQERILDALLKALALKQPDLLDAVRSILIETEFTHSGKPGVDQSVHQQIRTRLQAASFFLRNHGSGG